MYVKQKPAFKSTYKNVKLYIQFINITQYVCTNTMQDIYDLSEISSYHQ